VFVKPYSMSHSLYFVGILHYTYDDFQPIYVARYELYLVANDSVAVSMMVCLLVVESRALNGHVAE